MPCRARRMAGVPRYHDTARETRTNPGDFPLTLTKIVPYSAACSGPLEIDRGAFSFGSDRTMGMMDLMKTYVAKPAEVEKKWLLFDAEGLVLGRLAAEIARRLRGKHQADLHAPYGLRRQRRRDQRREGPRSPATSSRTTSLLGIRAIPAASRSGSKGPILGGKHPERVIVKAVERMVPRGPLGPAADGPSAGLCRPEPSP